MFDGILLIDKPVGVTSNKVVGIVRRRLERSVKVGHTGTLDPAASGLLVILVGAATRALDFLDEARKRYHVTIRLGEESDTCDSEGTITVTGDPDKVDAEQIGQCLKEFLGSMEQIPPHFSAIKKDGIPLYRLARKGIFPSLQSRKVEIFEISVIKWSSPDLTIDVTCSKGTYARSLARDIGIRLGVGARVETLRRVSSGIFHIENAKGLDFIIRASFDELLQSRIELGLALQHIPLLKVSDADLKKLANGVCVEQSLTLSLAKFEERAAEPIVCRVQDARGLTIVMARGSFAGEAATLKPFKVFNLL